MDEGGDCVGCKVGVVVVVDTGGIVGARFVASTGAAVSKRESEAGVVGVGTAVGSCIGALVGIGPGAGVWVQVGVGD